MRTVPDDRVKRVACAAVAIVLGLELVVVVAVGWVFWLLGGRLLGGAG